MRGRYTVEKSISEVETGTQWRQVQRKGIYTEKRINRYDEDTKTHQRQARKRGNKSVGTQEREVQKMRGRYIREVGSQSRYGY